MSPPKGWMWVTVPEKKAEPVCRRARKYVSSREELFTRQHHLLTKTPER